MPSLVEECCSRIVSQKSIPWFTVRHAKALSVLVKYKALFVSELMALSGIEKHEIHSTLSKLQHAKMVSFNGEKFVVKDAAKSMHRLLEIASATETSKVVARRSNAPKGTQRVV